MDSGPTVNDTWSEYAYIFKIEVSGLVDRLDVSYKKKIRIICVHNHWKIGITIHNIKMVVSIFCFMTFTYLWNYC